MFIMQSNNGILNIGDYAVYSNGLSVEFSMLSNGDTSGDSSGWYSPSSSGIGSGKWVILTATAGNMAMSGSTIGSRIELSSDRSWVGNISAGQIKFKNFTIEVWSEAAGGIMLDSGSLNLECENS